MNKSIAVMNIQKMAQWVVKNVAVQTSHELDKMKIIRPKNYTDGLKYHIPKIHKIQNN